MKDLRGKVAVVTGGAGGVGKALATGFGAEGMRLVLADVDGAGLDRAVAELHASGVEAIGVVTDVRSTAEVERLADETIAAFGAVHVVCNNAGVETGGAFADIPESAWRWVLDVNVIGVVNGCRVFLPHLKRSGGGHIVNTGSGASFTAGIPTFAPYVASKFAVLAISEALDMELRAAGEPIGVTLLAPILDSDLPNAERNRPADVPLTSGNAARESFLADVIRATHELGYTPADVSRIAIDAIKENRFFAVMEPEDAIAQLEGRLSWLRGGPAATLEQI